MTRKGQATRKTSIPVDYVVSDPNGNRQSRRIAAREAKAAARGRKTGHSSGAAAVEPKPPPADQSWIKMDDYRRRASLWTVWAPILGAALAGFVLATIVAVAIALSWRPDGMGM